MFFFSMFLWSHFHLTGTMGWSPISKAWTFGWSRSLWLAIAWPNCCNSQTSSRSIRSGGKSGWGCLLALRQPWTTFTIGFIAYFDNCSFIVLYIFIILTHQKLFMPEIIFIFFTQSPPTGNLFTETWLPPTWWFASMETRSKSRSPTLAF